MNPARREGDPHPVFHDRGRSGRLRDFHRPCRTQDVNTKYIAQILRWPAATIAREQAYRLAVDNDVASINPMGRLLRVTARAERVNRRSPQRILLAGNALDASVELLCN